MNYPIICIFNLCPSRFSLPYMGGAYVPPVSAPVDYSSHILVGMSLIISILALFLAGSRKGVR